ncbi:MAG: LPS export ABC transporter periplasmic protein LptC [Bacteroidales bacterium]|nr:LPS export ABC transporter periplasmic protein LptC [Bacteroidales bacterium]
MTAAALILFLFTACTQATPDIPPIDFEQVPMQTVDSMKAVTFQHENRSMEMTSSRLERYSYEKDSTTQSYELYLGGFCVKGYTETGELETRLDADQAKHITTQGKEQWMAYGNVVIVNYIKGERMETDTVYWDKAEKKIYTNNYVRMESQDMGFMQGYGMTTDERAGNTIIHRPFDSFGYLERDSTNLYQDTINFIGPVQRF